MEIKDYIDKIKFQLTGGVLETELPDESYEKIITDSMEELNKYYNVTGLLQVPASECIDLIEYPEIETVVTVHRTSGINGSTSDSSIADPVYMSQLQMYNMGGSYYQYDWSYNLAAYNTLQQVNNSMSTDLDFRYDDLSKKLYVNYSQGIPNEIVIEYVPKLKDVSEIKSVYWQDILLKLALANAKIILGRIRTRFVQSNALYTDDGDAILTEGQTELANLREQLRTAADLVLPID